MIIKYINFEIPANICISRIQNSIPVIILDAGHGGYDPGAVSGDILEKNINLAISQKLNDVLVCLGFKTIMTRNNDLALNDKGVNNKKQSDLNNRLEIINSEQDAILISVHQNMFSESKYRGSQVFYNSIPGSVEFAELLQKNIVNLLQKDNHRVSKSGDYLYLLNKSKHISVMLECGFMSNDDELILLLNEEYQSKLSYAVVISLFEYIFSYT